MVRAKPSSSFLWKMRHGHLFTPFFRQQPPLLGALSLTPKICVKYRKHWVFYYLCTPGHFCAVLIFFLIKLRSYYLGWFFHVFMGKTFTINCRLERRLPCLLYLIQIFGSLYYVLYQSWRTLLHSRPPSYYWVLTLGRAQFYSGHIKWVGESLIQWPSR